MRFAILGAGNVGGALAAAAVAAGHEVTISAATPEHAQAAAENAGARPAASNAEAVQDAELIVLAVPGSALPVVAAELGEALSGAVVVDSTNP